MKRFISTLIIITIILILLPQALADPTYTPWPLHQGEEGEGTITLISGSGNIGERDRFNYFSVDGGITYKNAFIISPFSLYSVIPGTKYINQNPDYSGPTFNSTLYKTTFELPAGFTNPSLTIYVHADNVATIFLNGTQIGQQTYAEIRENFQVPPETFTVNDPSLFQEGINDILIDVYNFNGPTGLDYLAFIGASNLSSEEIIGTWSNGIWYRNVAASSWTKMYSAMPSGDIAAGDFTGDKKADVASIWSSGLWFQNGATLGWTKVTRTAPYELTAGDVTGDRRAEIIGTWPSGIWYRNVAASSWTKMYSAMPSGDIAAGDFTGDKKADVASIWSSGLWFQNGATLGWTKVTSTAPYELTTGDVTGDRRAEIIGTWPSGIWYRNVAASSWTKMYSAMPSGDIAAGDFTGDKKADVASIWSSGLWFQNGATLGWTKVTSTAPYELTAGDVTGN